MITKTTRKVSVGAPAGTRPVQASTQITSGVQRMGNNSRVTASMNALSPEKRAFARILQSTARRATSITAATNTSNIMARPDFLELLPLFVQKLLVLDVFGSVAMRSRLQIIPYFKFVTENTKGATKGGTILSSPFVNRQGIDPNLTGRVVKGEVVAEGTAITGSAALMYTPVLPGTLTLKATISDETTEYIDDGNGAIVDAAGEEKGYIDYSTGAIVVNDMTGAAETDVLAATYQYDNETVGPDVNGEYGAKMVKGHLVLDEFDLKAEAHEMACYWSIYSAFVAQQEYGSNIADIAKEAAIAEITAEINTACFDKLRRAAVLNPAFNWDASPILSGAVVPSDYLNMFKLKLNQAAASIYQRTRLTNPNRLIVGTNVASYLAMVDGFQSEAAAENVGPYKLGKIDNFEVICDPNYNPDLWVMGCKSTDIRRNSALFGEYMPVTSTDAIGLANASVQQGYATMYGAEVVNPDTLVSGKILGTY